MDDRSVYPHGWNAQNSLELSLYLPKRPPPSTSSRKWQETHRNPPPKVPKRSSPCTESQVRRPEPTNNNVEVHGSPQTRPCACEASRSGFREQFVGRHLGNQSSAQPLDSVSNVRPIQDFEYERNPRSTLQPEETHPSGFEFKYPNMLNTYYDTTPKYAAPAWMIPKTLSPTLPTSESPAYIGEATVSSGGYHANKSSYAPRKPENSSFPRVPKNDIQLPNQASWSMPQRVPLSTYELDGQNLSYMNAWQERATLAEPLQAQPTVYPSLRSTREGAWSEAAYYHYTPTVAPAELSGSVIEVRREDYNKASAPSSYSAVNLQQSLALPPHQGTKQGLARTSDEIVGAVALSTYPAIDLKPPEPQPPQVVEFDSFCTPANQRFYSAKPYIELNQKLKELRLLRVFPKKPFRQHYDKRPTWDIGHASDLPKDQEVLACEIEKTSLARIGDNYLTISYCAGDANKTALIIVDGVPFNAFANLEHAIDRLSTHWTASRPGEPLLLWADQISINQSDKDERSEQVQIMREIYRRSAETYVCMSVPSLEDCLSWVPRALVHTRLADTVPGTRSSVCGVTVLKHLLLDLLVGKSKGGRLRSAASKTLVKSDVLIQQAHTSTGDVDLGFAQRVPVERCNTFPRTQSPWKAGVPPRGCIRSLTVDGTARYLNSEIAEVSAVAFQSSLANFITSRWWRRSWVYQEFLSANSIYFMSGSDIVPWSELSPLIDFICNGLDNFIEEARIHFESQITEEMETKHREEKEIERKLRKEEQQRQRQKEQRRALEEEERRRLLKEEQRQRELKEQQNRLQVEARQERQRQYQQHLENYNKELLQFEEHRKSEWRTALEAQLLKRAQFDKQQRLSALHEESQLRSQKKALNKAAHPLDLVQLNRELKDLDHFKREIMKPIDTQVKWAMDTITIAFNSKADEKLDEKCGGRLRTPTRIAGLRALAQVPETLDKFISSTLRPPTLPRSSPPLLGLDTNLDGSLDASESSRSHNTRQSLSGRLAEGQLASQKSSSRLSGRTSTNLPSSNNGLAFSAEPSSLSEDDVLSNQRSIISLDRLGAREIEQRDMIARLQDDFRCLDRSALASMIKGKKEFRRHSDLIALLQHSRNCLASDPRDRVYAFVGLAEPSYNIIPNYHRVNALEQVLIQTAKCIIQHDQSLRILQQAHRGRANLCAKLPSWVPDWTSKETIHGIDHLPMVIADSNPFQAGKDSRALTEFHHVDTPDGYYEYLKVRAVFVGNIDDRVVNSERDQVASLTLSGGRRAIGPRAALYDDGVWVLYGSTRPAVLRSEGDNKYGYLGDALILDENVVSVALDAFSPIMYGQLIDDVRMGTAEVEDIWLT